jgi:hypothetical protein
MCFSGCSVQGPGEGCEEGKRLFRDVEVAYQRVMDRQRVITPTTQEQEWHWYERFRQVYFAHIGLTKCMARC